MHDDNGILNLVSYDRVKTTFDLSPEPENYFRQLEPDLDATWKTYQHILTTLNAALPKRDYAALRCLKSDAGREQDNLDFHSVNALSLVSAKMTIRLSNPYVL